MGLGTKNGWFFSKKHCENFHEVRFLIKYIPNSCSLLVGASQFGGSPKSVGAFVLFFAGENMIHEIKQGLDVPISGKPQQSIVNGPNISEVGLLGSDYHGMRPTMMVGEGDKVQIGQKLFEDKKTPGVFFTSPAAGTVKSVSRGEKRRFLSVSVEVDNFDDQITFGDFGKTADASPEQLQNMLIETGLWTAFRTRPFSKVPTPGTDPSSIFVTAIDSNPLAAEPELIINEYSDHFVSGLEAVSRLTQGRTFVCTRTNSRVPGEKVGGVQFEQFSGPHPSGLVGTHIAKLDPVSPNKTVWHIGYNDVIAIGHFINTGRLMTERVIALSGPRVNKPGLVRTRLGANLDQVVSGNADLDTARVVSGSVLNGRTSASPENFLGRYHNQVTVLEEGVKREFLGWQGPGANKFSITNIYLGSLLKKLLPMSTNLQGSKRAMVPVETYERIMPLDILPTQLLRALIVRDTDQAQKLGCLELDEEDLALCTFVCPGKYDYGSILRDNLTTIEKEG